MQIAEKQESSKETISEDSKKNYIKLSQSKVRLFLFVCYNLKKELYKMSKIAVVYRSMTGHSKKIAKAIAAELKAEAQNVKQKPQLDDIDLLFIVGGIYSGKSLPEMTDYIKTINNSAVKKAALITSSVSDKKGQDEVRFILKSNGIEVIEQEYRCRGNFLFIKMGHPNKKEIAGAVEFAKNILLIL